MRRFLLCLLAKSVLIHQFLKDFLKIIFTYINWSRLPLFISWFGKFVHYIVGFWLTGLLYCSRSLTMQFIWWEYLWFVSNRFSFFFTLIYLHQLGLLQILHSIEFCLHILLQITWTSIWQHCFFFNKSLFDMSLQYHIITSIGILTYFFWDNFRAYRCHLFIFKIQLLLFAHILTIWCLFVRRGRTPIVLRWSNSVCKLLFWLRFLKEFWLFCQWFDGLDLTLKLFLDKKLNLGIKTGIQLIYDQLHCFLDSLLNLLVYTLINYLEEVLP